MTGLNPVENNVIQGRDIVIIGLQPWYYEIGSNCKSMALQFAKYNRVMYVNMPINRKTALSKNKPEGIKTHLQKIKDGADPVTQIQSNLWELNPTSIVESINWLPSTRLFRWVNRINNRRFAKNIESALDRLGFENVILFNDNDFFNGFELKELLKPSTYMYYSRDYIRGYDYWRKHGEELEPELIAKADIAVTNSLFLAEYCREFNKHSYYIGQGCDLTNFNPAVERPKPKELQGLKGPIVGYVGAIISARLDENILITIAEQRKDWNLVMVGPEDETFALSKLRSMPNVYFTGRKRLDELAGYVQHFDVCINPQLVNNITIGNYPLKIDEYLAMGKPVVATRTETMRLFEDHVWLADKVSDYPSLISEALMRNSDEEREERIRFARTHTWEACMEELYKGYLLQKENGEHKKKEVAV